MTDDNNADTRRTNHDYIGSLAWLPNEPIIHVHLLGLYGTYVQDMKFLWSNLWLGGLSTDDDNDDARRHIAEKIHKNWLKFTLFQYFGSNFITFPVVFVKFPIFPGGTMCSHFSNFSSLCGNHDIIFLNGVNLTVNAVSNGHLLFVCFLFHRCLLVNYSNHRLVECSGGFIECLSLLFVNFQDIT